MDCGRGSGLCHYRFAFEKPGRNAQSKPLKEHCHVALDVGTYPKFLGTDGHGDRADGGEFAQNGDGR